MLDSNLPSVNQYLIEFRVHSSPIASICKQFSTSNPVGTEPASPSRPALPPLEEVVLTAPAQPNLPPKKLQVENSKPSNTHLLLRDLQSILSQYIHISYLLQTIVKTGEEKVAVNCLSVIHSSVHMNRTQLSIGFKLDTVQTYYNLLSFPSNIISLYTKLCHQLFFPHQTEVRRLSHEILVQLKGIM